MASKFVTVTATSPRMMKPAMTNIPLFEPGPDTPTGDEFSFDGVSVTD